MLRLGVSLVWAWAWLWARVEGHGRLVDPPGRSSMWRLGFGTPRHYNDHELYCGGYSRQWVQNKGRCGECGDPWDLPRPRPQETGGTYGTGQLARAYHRGQVVTASVHLTANHMGWFEFRLCPVNEPGRYAKQSCLNQHVLALVDRPGTRYYLKDSNTGLFRVRLRLPAGLTCSRCVLQWHYTSGNNWGVCKDGSSKPGCGPQEVFRGCSDVAIFAPDDPTFLQYSNLTTALDLSAFLRLNEKSEYSSTKEPQQRPVLSGDLVDPLHEEDEDEALPAHLPLFSDSHVGRASSEYSAFQRIERKPTSTTNSPASSNDLRPQVKHTGKDDLSNGPMAPIEPRQLAWRQSPVTTFGSRKYMSSDVFRKTSLEPKRKLTSASTSSRPEAPEASPRGLSTPHADDTPSTRSILELQPLLSRSQSSPYTVAAELNSTFPLRSTATHRPFLTSGAAAPETSVKSEKKEDKGGTENLLPLPLKVLDSSAASAAVVPQLVTLQMRKNERRMLQKAIALAAATARNKGAPVVLVLGVVRRQR